MPILKKAVIFSHFAATGTPEEFLEYCIKKKFDEVIYIAFPFFQNSPKPIEVKIYKKGGLYKNYFSKIKFCKPFYFSFIKDFIYGIIYLSKLGKNADLFVGGDCLLTLVGIILRKILKIKNVVYYMIDYTPKRFENFLFNELYYLMDRIASYHSQRVWPLIFETINGRYRDKRLKPEKVKYHCVPYGTHRLSEEKFREFNQYDIAYMGSLVNLKGVELFVPIALKLKEKKYKFIFHVLGTGPYFEELVENIEKEGLKEFFKIYGYIEKFEDIQNILCKCSIGIAPYNKEDRNSYTYYADPGKIKVYLECGLPIVLTDVPPTTRLIFEKKAGLIADYNAIDFAEKIELLWKNLNEYKKNAIMLAKNFYWDEIFDEALSELFI